MEQNNPIIDYTEDRREEIIDIADKQYADIMNGGGDKYKEILQRVGENSISLSNMLYVLSQNPAATVVRNMAEWNRLGRKIMPNQNSLEIMAPTKNEETRELIKDGEPDLDEAGNVKTKTVIKTTGFHPAYIFDISATEGADYKPYQLTEKMTDRDKNSFLDGIYRALGTRRFKYKFVDGAKLPENMNCNIDAENKTIFVRKGMNNNDTVLTLLDATARAFMGYSKSRYSFDGLSDENAANVEAASLDCILAAHYGMDTSDYNFSCINEWDEMRKNAFRDNFNAICYSTKSITDKVDYALYRGQQSAVGVESVLAPRAPFRGFGNQREAVAE